MGINDGMVQRYMMAFLKGNLPFSSERLQRFRSALFEATAFMTLLASPSTEQGQEAKPTGSYQSRLMYTDPTNWKEKDLKAMSRSVMALIGPRTLWTQLDPKSDHCFPCVVRYATEVIDADLQVAVDMDLAVLWAMAAAVYKEDPELITKLLDQCEMKPWLFKGLFNTYPPSDGLGVPNFHDFYGQWTWMKLMSAGLAVAVRLGNETIVNLLLDRIPEEIDMLDQAYEYYEELNVIESAITAGHFHIVDLLLRRKWRLAEQPSYHNYITALICASQLAETVARRNEILERVLDEIPSMWWPKMYVNALLCEFAKRNNVQAAKLVLDRIDMKQFYDVHLLSVGRQCCLQHQSLSATRKDWEERASPLHKILTTATRYKNVEYLRFILEHWFKIVNVCYTDSDSRWNLSRKFVLENGYDVEVRRRAIHDIIDNIDDRSERTIECFEQIVKVSSDLCFATQLIAAVLARDVEIAAVLTRYTDLNEPFSDPECHIYAHRFGKSSSGPSEEQDCTLGEFGLQHALKYLDVRMAQLFIEEHGVRLPEPILGQHVFANYDEETDAVARISDLFDRNKMRVCKRAIFDFCLPKGLLNRKHRPSEKSFTHFLRSPTRVD